MRFFEKINKLKNFFLDLIFPKICLSCNKEGFYLCENCLEKIPLVDKLVCPVCGKITFYGQTCEGCQRKTPLTGMLYATSYRNPVVQEAIKLLKYKCVRELGDSLSQILIKFIKNSGFLTNNFADEMTSFMVIPIPLHRKKFLDRGFNQSEIIAQKIAAEFDLTLKTDLLIKTKNTRSQTDLKKEKERMINVKGVFSIKKSGGEIKNKIILLIDDVSTTGSTIEEAAKALKKAGAREIWGIVLAKG